VQRAEIDALFVRYREPVFRFLRRLLRDGAAAEDLTQDAFVRAMRGPYRSNGHERAWIFQIARNLARDHVKAAARRPAVVGLPETPAPGADRTDTLALEAAIAALDDEDRAVFLLKEIGGLSYAEIAEACGLTPDAVRSRLHRTRLALRKQLT
jgi:RNA polymerase sigma-70 factor (ECF subfamily)